MTLITLLCCAILSRPLDVAQLVATATGETENNISTLKEHFVTELGTEGL